MCRATENAAHNNAQRLIPKATNKSRIDVEPDLEATPANRSHTGARGSDYALAARRSAKPIFPGWCESLAAYQKLYWRSQTALHPVEIRLGTTGHRQKQKFRNFVRMQLRDRFLRCLAVRGVSLD